MCCNLYKNSFKFILTISLSFSVIKTNMSHLYQFFFLLTKYNIVINFKKTYIDFLTMYFFNQKVSSLEFFTVQEKINIITKLNFLKNFKNLETYFELIK